MLVCRALLLFYGCIGNAFSQNYIYNGSFERSLGSPDGLSEFFMVTGWENPVGYGKLPSPYPNPDYYHRSGLGVVKAPATQYGNIKPYDGDAMAGIICYASWQPNLREYLSTHLRSPLIAGTRYHLTFYMANAAPNRVCHSSVAHIGVCFSTQPFVQRDTNLLACEPKGTTKSYPFSEYWQRVSFDFIADTTYEYLSIGNFDNDEQCDIQQEVKTDKPCAYYFIDEVELVEVPNSESQTDEPLRLTALPLVLHTSVDWLRQLLQSRPTDGAREINHPNVMQDEDQEERGINVIESIEIVGDSVEIHIFDAQSVDGDTISLKYNDEWILSYHAISREPVVLRLPIEHGKSNQLVFFAHNLGAVPPNTATLTYRDGKNKVHYITIRSSLTKCTAVKFFRKTE